MEGAPSLTRAELALLDRLACEEYGLPSAVLMENAGRGAAEEILLLGAEARGRSERRVGEARSRIVVFAGPGNNGGDAYVVARHLANAGVEVEVFASSPRTEDRDGDRRDAARMRAAVERMGIAVHDGSDERGLERASEALATARVVVDGLLGTGFRAEVRPAIARLIDAVNGARRDHGAIVVALDLPSGLDADTGRPASPTVFADLTVTFAARKRGFDAPGAKPHLGRVVVATIGAPAELIDRVRAVQGASGVG